MKRIVVTSSMSVYGAQQPPFDENMPLQPEDIYGVAKASMEKALEILADVHKFQYSIIRPHNVYGPKQALWDPYRNVVAIFINRLMKNLPPDTESKKIQNYNIILVLALDKSTLFHMCMTLNRYLQVYHYFPPFYRSHVIC